MLRKRLIYCLVTFVTATSFLTVPAFGEDTCPSDPREALTEARANLKSVDESIREKGIVCLLTAVEAVQAQLDDLIAGKTEFEGPIVAPEFLYNDQQPQEPSQ